ncbi:Hypothetical protein PHPALM_9637 [Phytophthora palmivora]|uniref:M96 mating-specific protein family n=1 Tax=Phytophthora palmivora TaxID=4796 RepID=A0A2P4Y6S3_9STRA|nr:Hypothetical protein PHPALM_9637 [Phytophthora palmivora]
MLKKANDRTRSRSYYQRRQEEFQHLRQQVKKLTLTLSEQQKGRPESKAQLSTPWRLMAQWQRNARLNAEAQHRRLCAAVNTRATLIHELQTFLHDRLRLISDESHLFKHNKFHRSASDVNIFALRAQELDMIYAQTDKILHDFSLESTIDSWNAPKQSWKEDSQSGHFLYMNEQTISSEFQETCKFLWQIAFMTHRQENREQFNDIEDPENTVAIKFRITTRLNSGVIASVLQSVVTRRYQEGKRMVLAWRSLTEGEGLFTGMVAEETGWCVATPTRGNDTLLRTCMRHVPMHFRGIIMHNPEAKQFTSFVLDTGSNDIFETTIKLEELLKKMFPNTGNAKREMEKAKDRQRRAVYRVRRLTERDNLLQQVEDLTAELAQRQQIKNNKVPMSTTAWKVLALRLQQERQDAENQQRRLWIEIDARSTLLRDLYYRLACDNNADSSHALCQRKRMRLEHSDAKTYEQYLEELDGVYAKTDEMFQDFEVVSEDDGQWIKDVQTGSSHYKGKMVLPIDFHQACHALWDASHLPHRQNDRQHYGEVEDCENTAAYKFRITRQTLGRVASVVQRSVTRRYQDEGRLIVVWRSFLEGEGKFDGMYADETGWDELTPSEGGTVMKTYIHHLQMHVGAMTIHQPAMNKFNDIVLDSVSDIGEDIYQRFEKLLVTEG